MLYEYFIETDGKIPKKKHSESRRMTLDEAIASGSDFGGKLSKEYMFIDADDMDTAKKIMDTLGEVKFSALKTGKGMHFYFKTPVSGVLTNKTHIRLACGLVVDIKLGAKNVIDPIRVHGGLREWIVESESVDELPIWLYPIKGSVDFGSLSEGDGRNQALFNYILTLQSEGFSKDDIIVVINIINECILDEPLGQRELDVILRDEAFAKPVFFIKNQFKHENFGNWLVMKHNVCKINDVLHFYNGESYEHYKNLFAKMIQEIPSIKKAQRQEVWHYLNENITINRSQSSVKYINCANGVLDLESMELIEHRPDFLILNKIPTNFNPDAKSNIVDVVLLKLSNGDENMVLLLEEILGYCLYRRNELGKFFVLTGEGGGGKSTYLDMITRVLGENNVSSVSLQNLSERFQNTEIVGKLANIGDDISDKYIDDNSDIKKLTTGEAMQFEEKGQKPFRFRSYAKLLFASNKLPRINDMTDGLMRRIVTVPFNANFTRAKDYDPFIIDKLTTTDSLEYFLLLGVQGLKRILVNRAFTEVETVIAKTKEYEKLNNPILQFIDDGYPIKNEETKSVYKAYSVWCQENGYKAVSSVVFGREICKRLKVISKNITVDRSPKRIYVSFD